MTDMVPTAEKTPLPTADRSRRRVRLAAIGGIAAIAILGGGITAVASAAAPTSTTTTLDLPTSGATSPTSGAAAPSAGATSTTKAGALTPPVPRVHQPHMDGTVTSVSGSTVSIKDHDGFTRTILLSSKTTFSDGLTAALATGTRIRAEGTVDANGTSLDATVVGADKGPMGGPGDHGGRGPRGDRPVLPADGGPAGKAPDPGQSSGTGGATPPASSAPQTTS